MSMRHQHWSSPGTAIKRIWDPIFPVVVGSEAGAITMLSPGLDAAPDKRIVGVRKLQVSLGRGRSSGHAFG
jgi:hypothetical protein